MGSSSAPLLCLGLSWQTVNPPFTLVTHWHLCLCDLRKPITLQVQSPLNPTDVPHRVPGHTQHRHTVAVEQEKDVQPLWKYPHKA